MAWEVEFTKEFEAWWNGLTEEEQVELDAKVHLLEQHGPVLPRPHSDVIATSKHANMKELRGRVVFPRHRAELRVLYAFDPRRMAILLIGETKPETRNGTTSMCRLPIGCSPSICGNSQRRKGNVARNFRELRKTMSPEAQAKARVLAQKYAAQMPLDELRAARQMTQEHLAKLLGTKQAAISKLERRTDMYLSTLQSVVKAMGGQLRIEAVFPEGAVEIKQLQRVRKSKTRAGTAA